MPHSYVSTFIHYIFGTRERFPFIDQELESRLWLLHRRDCEREWDESHRGRWYDGSPSHSFVLTFDNERRKSNSTNYKAAHLNGFMIKYRVIESSHGKMVMELSAWGHLS